MPKSRRRPSGTAITGCVRDITSANKAPGGFGLGDDATLISADTDLNSITKNGWYQFLGPPIHAPTSNQDGWNSGYSALFVNSRNGEVVTQTIFCSNMASVYGCQIKRVFVGGKWYPWEWLNPPMELGVEYRTTERCTGQPVYYKMVDCGKVADNKQVEHGIENMLWCISAQGLRAGMPMPGIFNHNLSDPWSCYIVGVSATKITLACGTSAAGGNCVAILKYTKTVN